MRNPVGTAFNAWVELVEKAHRLLRVPLYMAGTAGVILGAILTILSGIALIRGFWLDAALVLLAALAVLFVSLGLLVGPLSGHLKAKMDEDFYRMYPNAERPTGCR